MTRAKSQIRRKTYRKTKKQQQQQQGKRAGTLSATKTTSHKHPMCQPWSINSDSDNDRTHHKPPGEFEPCHGLFHSLLRARARPQQFERSGIKQEGNQPDRHPTSPPIPSNAWLAQLTPAPTSDLKEMGNQAKNLATRQRSNQSPTRLRLHCTAKAPPPTKKPKKQPSNQASNPATRQPSNPQAKQYHSMFKP